MIEKIFNIKWQRQLSLTWFLHQMQTLATKAYVYLPRKKNPIKTNRLSRQLVVHKQTSLHRTEVQGMTVLDEPKGKQKSRWCKDYEEKLLRCASPLLMFKFIKTKKMMSHTDSTGTKNIFFQGDKSGQNSSEYGEIMIQTHYSKGIL